MFLSCREEVMFSSSVFKTWIMLAAWIFFPLSSLFVKFSPFWAKYFHPVVLLE